MEDNLLKRKYVVYNSRWDVQMTLNESEVTAFISDTKGLPMYAGMHLQMQDTDGRCYEWNSDKCAWDNSGIRIYQC